MALEWQTVDIPLGGGRDDARDPFLVDAPASLELVNARFERDGSIEKRRGFDAIAWTPERTPHTLLTRGTERTVITTRGQVFRYDANADWERLSAPRSTAGVSNAEQHRVLPVELERRGVVRSEAAIGYADVAIASNGIACQVWIDADPSGTGGYQIVTLFTEATTGRVISGPTRLPATASLGWDRVWVVDIGTRFVLVALDGTPGSLKSFHVETSATIGTWTTGATVAAASTNVVDLARDPSGTHAHLAYALSTNVELVRLDNTGAVTQTATIATDATSAVSLAMAANGTLYVLSAGSSSSSGRIRRTICTSAYSVTAGPTDLAVLTGSQVFAVSVVTGSTGQAWACWQEEYETTARRCVRIARFDGNGAMFNPSELYNYCIAAHGWYDPAAALPMFPVAWQPDNRTTSGGAVRPTVQPLGLVVAPCNFAVGTANQKSLACVSRFAVDRYKWAVGAAGIRQNVPSSATYSRDGATRGMWVVRVQGDSSTVEGVDAFTLGPSPVPMRRASFEGCVYVSGGHLAAYDGQSFQESSPHLAPEQLLYSESGTGITGTFSWVVVWEWEDAQGVLRRSAPSQLGTASPSNKTARIDFCDQQVRSRDGVSLASLRAALYRTTNGGSVFYLVRRGVPTPSAVAGDVYFTDNNSDSTIQENETLYTDAGILPNQAPPPCLDVLIAKGRCWAIDAERRTDVVYSKLLQGNSVAPEFAGEFRIRLPRGEATALASIDDKLLVFTADECFAIFGDGPNDTGTQGFFSEPQPVALSVGCIDRCSVVSGDFGVMFRSRRGLELMSRGLQVTPGFAERCQGILTSAAITSATTVAAQSQVRITQAGGTNMLVYDYDRGAWCVWTLPSILDAAMAGGVYVGQELTQTRAERPANDANEWSDHDTFFGTEGAHTLTITTPWIKLAGLQGFKRIRRAWLLGRYRGTSYGWSVQMQRDYLGTTVQTESGSGTDGVAGRPWQTGVHLTHQRVEALRLVWSDLPRFGGGGDNPWLLASPGITLAGISLEVGGKRGQFKLAAARKT